MYDTSYFLKTRLDTMQNRLHAIGQGQSLNKANIGQNTPCTHLRKGFPDGRMDRWMDGWTDRHTPHKNVRTHL